MASLMPLQRSVTPWKVTGSGSPVMSAVWGGHLVDSVCVLRLLLRFDPSVRKSSCPLWITPGLSSRQCSKVIGWDCTGESFRCVQDVLKVFSCFASQELISVVLNSTGSSSGLPTLMDGIVIDIKR